MFVCCVIVFCFAFLFCFFCFVFYTHLGYPLNIIFVFHSHVMWSIPLPSRGKVGKNRSAQIVYSDKLLVGSSYTVTYYHDIDNKFLLNQKSIKLFQARQTHKHCPRINPRFEKCPPNCFCTKT